MEPGARRSALGRRWGYRRRQRSGREIALSFWILKDVTPSRPNLPVDGDDGGPTTAYAGQATAVVDADPTTAVVRGDPTTVVETGDARSASMHSPSGAGSLSV